MKETRYLEVLRARFGGTDLDQCDVMLADMAAWSRADEFVHARMYAASNVRHASGAGQIRTTAPPPPVSVRVISEHYWPKVIDEQMPLPSAVNQQLAAYNTAFGTYKPNRHLELRPQVGNFSVSELFRLVGNCEHNVVFAESRGRFDMQFKQHAG
jgi:anaphase-promoting complex subunit 2